VNSCVFHLYCDMILREFPSYQSIKGEFPFALYATVYDVKERCLLIIESPKTPGHYRYLIRVLYYIP